MAKKIFEGIKILDFTWVGVGPVTTKYFADHGATVVHVESTTRPDVLRLAGPFRDNEPGNDKCGFFANFNSSKYGITLNLATEEGKNIAKDLIIWADVVANSYTPRVMEKWGLDYESIYKIKPDIINFATCQQGQTGPYRDYAGFGTQGAALAGVYHITGWPDRPPAGPYGAYTDFINPRMGALAIAAALDYKRRTGKGTNIDLSQTEGGMQFLAPTILQYSANKESANRSGNQSDYQSPHGVFPCKGEERWIAIAVSNDKDWQNLVNVIGNPDWAHAEKFSTLSLRIANNGELECHMWSTTIEWDAYELMNQLQAHEVPAGVVQKTSDLFSDPQLKHRKHFWFLDHPEIGNHSYDGPSFRFSKTPGELSMPAPVMGQHNEYVYKDLLGMTEEQFVENLINDIFE
jgi:benzylsuccinate CoA-transferase BbsF subunit